MLAGAEIPDKNICRKASKGNMSADSKEVVNIVKGEVIIKYSKPYRSSVSYGKRFTRVVSGVNYPNYRADLPKRKIQGKGLQAAAVGRENRAEDIVILLPLCSLYVVTMRCPDVCF